MDVRDLSADRRKERFMDERMRRFGAHQVLVTDLSFIFSEQGRLYGEVMRAQREYDRAKLNAGRGVVMFKGENNGPPLYEMTGRASPEQKKWSSERSRRIKNDIFCQRAKVKLDEAREAYHRSLAA